MDEQFGRGRGILRREDIKKVLSDLQDEEGFEAIIEDLKKREPLLCKEADRFAREMAEDIWGFVEPHMLRLVRAKIGAAVIVGFLLHKKAHDRLWEGVNVDKKI